MERGATINHQDIWEGHRHSKRYSLSSFFVFLHRAGATELLLSEQQQPGLPANKQGMLGSSAQQCEEQKSGFFLHKSTRTALSMKIIRKCFELDSPSKKDHFTSETSPLLRTGKVDLRTSTQHNTANCVTDESILSYIGARYWCDCSGFINK